MSLVDFVYRGASNEDDERARKREERRRARAGDTAPVVYVMQISS